MTHDEALEKIELYHTFNEGTEIQDAVVCLLDAARALSSLQLAHEFQLTMLTAEKLMRDFFFLVEQGESFTWEYYDNINPELYVAVVGRPKLTKEQWDVLVE